MTSPHITVGKRGEDIAARYLHHLAYHVLAGNVRSGRHGEIDLIAHDPSDDVLVFVEVKTRTRFDVDYLPHLGMSRRKKQRLQRSIRQWVAEHAYEGGYRLDVLCIAEYSVIDHIQDMQCDT